MDSRAQASTDEQQITAADIARLAGVTRAAVSNWRRRHDDFPAPSGGTSSSPLFPLAQVRTWLESQNKGAQESPEVRLWHTLRGDHPGNILTGLADLAEYLEDPAGGSGELSAAAVEQADKLVRETSAAEVSRALAERFLNSSERAGTAATSTARLVRAVTALTRTDAASVFDPACGSGALLLSVGAPQARRRGQDTDPDAVRFAAARARIEKLTDAEFATGDSLREDRWPGEQAELVVCDPPPATTDWGREELLMDPRWELALPPKAEGELAWLQHAYAHTAPGGQTAVVLSTSCAYRRTGRRIRAELVRRGLLTDVIALPAGLASSHSQPVHLWLLRRPVEREDAATAVRMWDLTGADPDQPWQLPDRPGAEIPLIDLLAEDVDLSPARHVAPDLAEIPEALAEVRADLERLTGELGQLLPIVHAGTAERLEQQVRVGDLVDAGLVQLDGDRPRAVDQRLDSDFLNGFLTAAANTRRSTSASGTYRTDARAARVPKLEPEEQRRYGAAFRALGEFERRARELSALADRAAELTREGLTSGALAPEQDS
ncbi:SAM-dependent methyltransferase [Nocardiopsis exhalans]|uniref:SAM-dependent methyltransferase n=1 Tax=Nocardiopsis exhalans TaxID=163604 RepID=A0ABY5D2R8_9ACTN|nr:N-6 DNA methylase [Nocardiopsis exhalans]USY17472.1 SAM-dependent methyltransferase [Nocardiopsis exhalans]